MAVAGQGTLVADCAHLTQILVRKTCISDQIIYVSKASSIKKQNIIEGFA